MLIKGTAGRGAASSRTGAQLVTDALKSAPGETIVDMKSPDAPKVLGDPQVTANNHATFCISVL